MRKNIAVVTGGSGAELGISLKSAEVVYQHINREKFTIYKVIIDGKKWVVENENVEVDKNDFSFQKGNEKVIFDAAFVVIHGTPAEDGKLQGYFELLSIPYTCCGVLQAALTFDKNRTKEYLSQAGIKSAQSVLATSHENKESVCKKIISHLAFPVFVKPNKNGSSYGAAKVDQETQLLSAVEEAFKYDDEILIEEFLQGTEVTCGVISVHKKATALPITEIRTKNSFFDYQAKYEGKSQEVTPAEINAMLYKKVQETSVAIYEKLGFKGFCRIDFIIKDEQHYLLEVNSIPGLSPESIVPQQAKAFGLSLQELFTSAVEDCLV